MTLGILRPHLSMGASLCVGALADFEKKQGGNSYEEMVCVVLCGLRHISSADFESEATQQRGSYSSTGGNRIGVAKSTLLRSIM